MLYSKINYCIHLLLNYKHYNFIYIFIVVLVYTYLNFFNLSYCMMEEPGTPLSDISLEIEGENVPPYSPSHPLYVAPEYPETAEAKQELASQSPILQEIESYTASQEQLLKRLNDQADHFARQERMMTDRLSELMQEKYDLCQQISEARQEISQFRQEHSETLRKAYNDAYKVYMEHFNKNQEK